MRNVIRTAVAFLLLGTLLNSGIARADGCYVPEKAVVKLPKIPVQRAIISYRDGKQTLVVESTAKGKGTRFGWIVPVPGKPESVRACTPGALKSLAMAIQPKIVNELDEKTKPFALISLLIIVLCVIAAAVKRKPESTWGKALVRTSVYGGLILLVFAMLIPSLLAARRSSLGMAGGITVLGKTRAGSYDVTSLQADDADALYAWLKSEGLAVPAAIKPVVAEYAKDGWYFVTAKLVVEEGKDVRAHPLAISFKTKRAVYPMKLTGLNGAALDLELYVIAEKAADAPGMKRIFCDRFTDTKHSSAAENLARALGEYDTWEFEAASGEKSGLEVGHPDLRKLMWKGCWLSKLSGKVPSAAMADDFYLEWSEPVYTRQKLYSAHGAWGTAWSVAGVILVLCVPVALIMWGSRRMKSKVLAASLAGTLAIAVFTAGLVRMSLPVIEVTTYGGKWSGSSYELHRLVSSVREKVLLSRVTPEEAVARVRKELPDLTNIYTGEPMIEEDSPGNYKLSREGGKPVLTVYDLGGTPVKIAIKEPGHVAE